MIQNALLCWTSGTIDFIGNLDDGYLNFLLVYCVHSCQSKKSMLKAYKKLDAWIDFLQIPYNIYVEVGNKFGRWVAINMGIFSEVLPAAIMVSPVSFGPFTLFELLHHHSGL